MQNTYYICILLGLKKVNVNMSFTRHKRLSKAQ